jgi:hypothetical protein
MFLNPTIVIVSQETVSLEHKYGSLTLHAWCIGDALGIFEFVVYDEMKWNDIIIFHSILYFQSTHTTNNILTWTIIFFFLL